MTARVSIKQHFGVGLAAIVMFLAIPMLQAQSYTVSGDYDKPAVLKKSGNKPGEYYANHFIYPAKSVVEGIEGTVEVDVGINAQGVVESAVIQRSLSKEVDEAVRQLVMTKGQWKPATKSKVPVSSVQRVVINLRLSESQREFANIVKPFLESEKFPLYVIDGKLVNDYVELQQYQIKSVRVLKGQNASSLYGEAGANGVVEIVTKRGTPPVR